MTLKKAIRDKKISVVRSIAKSKTQADIADLLEKLPLKDTLQFFNILKEEQRSEIFNALEDDYKLKLIKIFSDSELKSIVGELFADEIADIVDTVQADFSKRILDNTDKQKVKKVNKILGYSDDKVGSFMSVEIVSIKQTLTVEKTIALIKNKKEEAELTHYFFVVDNQNKLVGYILTEDLLFSTPKKVIKTIMKPTTSVTTTTDKEVAALKFANYDMSVLPVVNSNDIFVGVITSDDVIDVMQESATEDIHKMAGIDSPSDIPYSKTGIFRIFKSRVFWLMLLMISATLSQIVLDAFQKISNDALLGAGITSAIVAILPVISGAAGNAGSQSSTTVIRALAIGDISSKQYLKVFWKEFRVALLMGFALGVANIARLFIYYGTKGELAGSQSTKYIVLSLAASLSIFIVIILAKIVGGLLPLVAKSLKLDPAVMAAPLLTTLIDALSTLIFFGVSIGIMILVI